MDFDPKEIEETPSSLDGFPADNPALKERLKDRRRPSTSSAAFDLSSLNFPEVDRHYGVHSAQGIRATMEDAHRKMLARPSSADGGGTSDSVFLGVFDGHAGVRAAQFASDNCFEAIKQSPTFQSDLAEAVRAGLLKTEEMWMKQAQDEDMDDGTTAVVAVLRGDELVVGNVGDSEAVLCRAGEPLVLTTLHNPAKNEAEVQRVTDAGGRIFRKRVGHPIWNPAYLSIAVSRSIGDMCFKTTEKPSGLIADPDVKVEKITKDDAFLLIACDGLFDVFSYQDALEFVQRGLADGDLPKAIMKNIVDAALEKGGTDNITAMLYVMDHDKSLEKTAQKLAEQASA